MTKFYFCLLIAFLSAITLSAQAPTIGTYPNTTVVAGQNVTVTPSTAPTNTSWMVVSSSTNFKGVLTATTSSGVVNITDAMHAGVYTITVKAAQPFASASTTFQLTVTNPTCSQGLFRFSSTVSGQSGLQGVAVGDFNNDGIQDLAMANSTFGSISVRLGNGTGGFSGTTELGAGTTRYLAIGDLNCDGNQDIVNSNVNGAVLYVHLGNGAGGFAAPISVPVNAFPTGVSIGDFNNDGFKDLAAGTSANTVSIRLGDGTGNFSGTGSITLPTSAAWTNAIGDFNEDGNQDLAITSGSTVSIRFGDGAGGFTGAGSYPVGTGAQTVVVADFNNDAHQDFAVTNSSTGSVSVRLGDGFGGFSGTTELALGASATGLAAGDFNGDGNTDLAISRFTSIMHIRYGDGMGGFTGTTSFSALTSGLRTIAVGDFNSDGFQDLAIASESGGLVPIFLGGAAEINITGSSNTIVDGDATPSATDGTYFGSNCGGGPITKTFVIQNTGLTTLQITNVGISGPGAGDYNITVLPATTLAPAATTSFQVQFIPSAQGVQNATVSVYNTDCDEAIYDFAISAVSANAVSLVPMGETDITCTGSNNGTAAVGVSGGTAPYTYDWSPGTPSGDGTSNVTGLTVGTWSVLVTDVSGCSATQTYSITQPSPVSGSTVVTNVSCYGGNTGAINLTPSGGTGSYTYSWNPGGQTTEDRTGLTQGTYTVTITDGNSCTGTVTATVTQPATPVSGTTVVTNVSCFGGANGAINLTPAGGTPPYIYQWLPSGPYTEDRTGLAAGTYTVWILDANSCFASVTATVTQPASAITASISSTPRSCATANGTATVSGVTGGTPGYTYSWSPSGGTAAVATGLAAGSYICTITDNNGCTITRTVAVGTTPSPSLALSAFSNVNCFGGNTGIIGVAPAFGGTAPYSYDWTPGTPVGDGTRQINDLTAGTYTCTVTDANGCTGTFSYTITQPAAPVTGTTVVTNVACFGGSNGTINLTPAGGTGPYTFLWSTGQTTEDRTGLAQGTYSVQITDTRGCTTTVSAGVTQPAPVSGTTTVTNVSCNGGSNGAIDLTPAGGTGPYTYFWAPTLTSEDLPALTAGTYTVLITDANGCSGTASAIVTEPAPIAYTFSHTDVSCNGGSNGSATITPSGGTAPYTYAWSSGGTGQTETGLAAGTYSFLITDANMCQTAAVPVTISEPTAVLINSYQTNVNCFATNTGYIEVFVSEGTGPYTYLWNTGSTATFIYDLAPGNYSVLVTDANGCSSTATFLITGPAAALTATVVDSDVTCNGGNNGSATVSPAGGTAPYTYTWSTSATTPTVNGLAAGSYYVYIFDANGCQATAFANITEPPALLNTLSQTDVSCNGGSNGTATATVSGGIAPYTYAWSSGGTAATESGLAAGNYSVHVTDANGCSVTYPVTIAEPAVLNAGTATIPVSCNGGNDGSSTVTVSGGTAPYTYAWSNGGTNATETGLLAGSYTCTITDANGCTAMASIIISEPSALAATFSTTDPLCNGGNDGDATVTMSGGTAPYTYAWSSGGTNATETGLAAGTYTVFVIDAAACNIMATVTLTEPTAIVLTTTSDSASCPGSNDGAVTVNASGGMGYYTFAWSSGGNTATESALATGTYTVTVTDIRGCTAQTTATVEEPAAIYLPMLSTSVSCFGGNNGSLYSPAQGGTAPYNYSWSSGGTTDTESGLFAGTYTLVVTDAHGCSATATQIVYEPSQLVATVADASNPTTCGGTDGSIQISVSGGAGYYSFLWSNSATTQSLFGIGAGSYTLTVTDVNGCTATIAYAINDPNAPAVSVSLPMDTACGSFPGTVVLSGEFPMGGTWSGNTVSGNTFDPFNAGVGVHYISYSYTDINGCTGTATDSLYVDMCMSAEEIPATTWSLYPNPTSGSTTLTTGSEVNSDVTVEVYTAEGKLLRAENHQQSTLITIDLSNDPVGVYFLRITTNTTVQTHRVVRM